MSTIESQLATIFSGNWWALLLRGLIAIAFGVVIWFQPGFSLAALVLLFGAYAMADGILSVWTAIAGRKEHEHWWVLLLGGILGICVGILAFIAPGVTALVLLFYIAIWAISTGVLGIVAGIRLRKEIEGEWLLILSGLVSVVFGALLVLMPGAGALVLLWMIASYAVVFGILLVILAFKMRGLGRQAAVRNAV